MGFNKNVIAQVKEEYSQKYQRAQMASDNKRFELWQKIPGLKMLDSELAMTGVRIMEVTMKKEGDVRLKIEQIKQQNAKLLAEREALLLAYGYPKDYTDVKYECEKCGDSGYVDTAMCDCMKKALVIASYESSGIGVLIKAQSFDNFSLDYYRRNEREYQSMKFFYEKLKKFAESFSKDTYTNYLFIGGTGLGKTHLSSAIAKSVIDRHFDVLYVTSAGLLGDFEKKRFGNSAIEGDVGDTTRYYSADLLIIDDLGTEITNQFTVSCLFDIINSRMIAKKPTIINTNLSKGDLEKRYGERIASRLFGEYEPILFCGVDVRRQKITSPKK